MFELFKNIDNDNKNKLLQELEVLTRSYQKNEIILSTIKEDDIICIVLEGHIQVTKNDFNGNRIVIEDVKENEIFGSISANISNSDYEIITKEDSKIIIMELDMVFNHSNNDNIYNIFVKNLLRVLYDKIKEFNNHIDILNSRSIRDKLLAYFKIMVKSTGSNTIYIPFSYSDLADYLATNRSAMAREIKSLKDEGLISVKGRQIKLLYYVN